MTPHSYPQSYHFAKSALVLLPIALFLGGCQAPKPMPMPATPVKPLGQTTQKDCNGALRDFHKSGKLGVTTLKDGKHEAFSAFYDWSQKADGTFSLALWGAFGASAQVSYDGQTATLIAGENRQSDLSPKLLLSKVLGVDAPIDSLALWVLGECVSHQPHTLDNQNRLSHASQSDWSAQLFYEDNPKPSRLVLLHKDGHRLVMTAQP